MQEGRPDLYGRRYVLYAPKCNEVQRQYPGKYGWGNPGLTSETWRELNGQVTTKEETIIRFFHGRPDLPGAQEEAVFTIRREGEETEKGVAERSFAVDPARSGRRFLDALKAQRPDGGGDGGETERPLQLQNGRSALCLHARGGDRHRATDLVRHPRS